MCICAKIVYLKYILLKNIYIYTIDAGNKLCMIKLKYVEKIN